ncbi:uncharacterized protein DS421_19g655780 [Arachis hypogaea]|uniref:Uncharacterized protein n=1 Tax=Arachis hypogaea TaxID=3818 RepID=A0A6B9V8V6_ARAHY|nr:uncharacterized protein DS421_19g655780 [Arachis hypogaea]
MLHFKYGEVAISGVYFGEPLHTFSFILNIFLYFSFYCYFLSTYTLLLCIFTLFLHIASLVHIFSYLV